MVDDGGDGFGVDSACYACRTGVAQVTYVIFLMILYYVCNALIIVLPFAFAIWVACKLLKALG